MSKLFDDVVSCTGLAQMIAPGAVQRALSSVGVASPNDARPEDYRRALPELKARMAVYLSPEEVARRAAQIEALTSR